MKKLISVLLCLVMIIACCTVALGKEVTMTFSFNKVSGQKGDIVYVNFSVLEENTYATNFTVKFGYDVNKVQLVEHPESKKWFTPGPAFVSDDSTEEYYEGMSYDFNKETMTLCAAEPTSLERAGVMGTFAFRLLEDLPEEQPILACCVLYLPCYYPDLVPVDSLVIENNLESFDFSDFDPEAMKENNVNFTLSSASGRKNNVVLLEFGLEEKYTHISEFEVEFSFDKSQIQFANNPKTGKVFTPDDSMANCEISFDEATGRLTFSNPNGLVKNGTIGTLALQIVDINAPGLSVPVTATFVKEPKHSQQSDFVYNLSVTQGSVTMYASLFSFQLTNQGAVLVAFQGNESVVRIPQFYDGVPVVGIGEKVFENCMFLKQVFILNGVTQIAQNAFEGCDQSLTIYCGKNSTAEQFAKEQGFGCSHFVSAETVTDTDVLALGDPNGDTVIDAKDALITLQMSILKYPFSPTEEKAADVTKNGIVDAKDALEILKKSVGKPACF